MVNFSEERKTEVKANGKLVVKDFSAINVDDFKHYDMTIEQMQEQTALISFDGRLYVNSNSALCETVAGVFEALIPETRRALGKYTKVFRKKFPSIRTFDDWGRADMDNEQRVFSLALLLKSRNRLTSTQTASKLQS